MSKTNISLEEFRQQLDAHMIKSFGMSIADSGMDQKEVNRYWEQLWSVEEVIDHLEDRDDLYRLDKGYYWLTI